jgi:hypothetical protein
MSTTLTGIEHDKRESSPIPESSSFTIAFTVQDEDGTAVAGSALDTCTLTLYNDRAGEVINSRTAVDILGANGGAITEAGAGTWQAVELDSPIEQGTLDEEDHTALIVWQWTPAGVQKTGRAIVRLRVVNIEKVT